MDRPNVKPVRTISGGGPFRVRRLRDGLEGTRSLPVRERKSKALWPAPKGRGQGTDDDEREEAALAADQRERARDDERRRGSSRCRLPGVPGEASSRELTRRREEEREARENHQWRRRPFRASDDWMGVRGKQSFPLLRERRRKLSGPPL